MPGIVLDNVASLIVPQFSSLSDQTAAPKGSLAMSGAKLYIATAAGTWELVTSS